MPRTKSSSSSKKESGSSETPAYTKVFEQIVLQMMKVVADHVNEKLEKDEDHEFTHQELMKVVGITPPGRLTAQRRPNKEVPDEERCTADTKTTYKGEDGHVHYKRCSKRRAEGSTLCPSHIKSAETKKSSPKKTQKNGRRKPTGKAEKEEQKRKKRRGDESESENESSSEESGSESENESGSDEE